MHIRLMICPRMDNSQVSNIVCHMFTVASCTINCSNPLGSDDECTDKRHCVVKDFAISHGRRIIGVRTALAPERPQSEWKENCTESPPFCGLQGPGRF